VALSAAFYQSNFKLKNIKTMETLNKVFTEKQVDEVSDKILKSTIEKIKSELSDKYYNEMSSLIYEHYSNASDTIHENLIKEITDEFVNDPKNYKFLKLRQKIFNENKEQLTKILTDEAIYKTLENVIWQYTNKEYHFSWKWTDALVRIIGENWHKFKDDERVNNGLLRQIEQLKSQISHLQEKLNDIQNVVSEQD
jgi:uncharacterized coiled-coil protein SlyX